ncbi:EZH inhibitory protein [Canis lupus baileyi]|uniref:EZH inhibitory protein n=1 Tax=Canis lupus baileyi TaxID=143281 RepID=UPI003B96CF9B
MEQAMEQAVRDAGEANRPPTQAMSPGKGCRREQLACEEAAQAQKPPWRRCFLGFLGLSAPCLCRQLRRLSPTAAAVLGLLCAVSHPSQALPSEVRSDQAQLSAVKQPGQALPSTTAPPRQVLISSAMNLSQALFAATATTHLSQALLAAVAASPTVDPSQALLYAAAAAAAAAGPAALLSQALPSQARPREAAPLHQA